MHEHARWGSGMGRSRMTGAHAPRRARLTALVAGVATALMLITTGVTSTEPPAFAATYPSWDDVLEARNNVNGAKQKADELRALIQQLEAAAAAAQAESERLGKLYEEAQLAFDEASFQADELQRKSDEAAAKAEESRQRAGQFVAELSRAGGADLSASLFTNPDQAESLLSRLGYASKISEQAEGIYSVAMRDQQAAQSFADQAEVAKQKREELRVAAEAAFQEAQEAAAAAAAAVAEQQENKARLEVQIQVLVEGLQITEAQYNEGERIRKEEEERRRQAELRRQEELRRLEEERRRAEAAANAGGGGGGGGAPVASGWAKPAYGWISSGFGYRIHPIYGTYRLHTGTDIAAGCGQAIAAAASGTVIYAGPNGTYGNFVMISHGNGLTTGYAHILDGGIRVGYGQQVSAGQTIAAVGSTGASNGCHLHFEVRTGGTAIDPVPFMANRGVYLG
jgi:murein DD-endopeptidase MepM/ murein hydrolase activator NlpD